MANQPVQTTLIPPVLLFSQLNPQEQLYMQTIQYLLQLFTCDTSLGEIDVTLPPAGSNPTTGQSAQNQELTYIKTTADTNNVVITGAISGVVTLTTQWQAARFKSDATNWYAVP